MDKLYLYVQPPAGASLCVGVPASGAVADLFTAIVDEAGWRGGFSLVYGEEVLEAGDDRPLAEIGFCEGDPLTLEISRDEIAKSMLRARGVAITERAAQDAGEARQYDVVRLLIATGDVCGDDALLAVVRRGYTADRLVHVRHLLESGCHARPREARGLSTALHCAVRHDQPEFTRVLLEYGYDPNPPAKHGAQTGVNSAGENRWSTARRRALARGVHQPDVPAPNLLFMAACFEYAGVGRVLLQYGADAALSDDASGLTPLHIAARDDAVEFVEMMLEVAGGGASTLPMTRTAVGSDGGGGGGGSSSAHVPSPTPAPLSTAELGDAGRLVRRRAHPPAAVESVADVHAHAPAHAAPEVVPPSPPCESEGTPTGAAGAAASHAPAPVEGHGGGDGGVDVFIDRRVAEPNYTVDTNVRTRHAMTPLHLAAEHGAARTVAVLVRHGADVRMKDASGATPLHTAALAGIAETVSVLLAADAPVDVQSDAGETPLDVAYSIGHVGIVQAMQRAQRRQRYHEPAAKRKKLR